ncbi:MAG: hypothetical protein WA584_03505 [Pyrinomonadaceae bacterium]
MAKNKTKRLRPAVLQENLDAYAALKAIANYNPSNPDFAIEKVKTVFDKIQSEQTLEVQKNAAADAQRDKTVAAEWDGQDIVRGFRTQVKAQFGEDSDEYASTGMKKKSDYKTGGRRKSSNQGGTT